MKKCPVCGSSKTDMTRTSFRCRNCGYLNDKTKKPCWIGNKP